MIKEKKKYSTFQLTVLVAARVLIGWYCLYEGVIKLMNSNWSSFAFLSDSQGWFAFLFKAMASSQWIVSIIDFLNVWGLIAIGLGLILGLFARMATISGIVLISLYWLSHPALINAKYILPSEESTMWVGKNLIFIFLLFILLAFPTSKKFGIDRLIFRKSKKE
jgi:thiosulfate dehydrogenase (quinone) large subunit